MNNIPFSFLKEISISKTRILRSELNTSLEIEFRYNDGNWWLFYIEKSPDKKIINKYMIVTDEGNYRQEFETMDELYEKAIIDSKYLKDIWSEIELITIFGCDPQKFYVQSIVSRL